MACCLSHGLLSYASVACSVRSGVHHPFKVPMGPVAPAQAGIKLQQRGSIMRAHGAAKHDPAREEDVATPMDLAETGYVSPQTVRDLAGIPDTGSDAEFAPLDFAESAGYENPETAPMPTPPRSAPAPGASASCGPEAPHAQHHRAC